MTLKHFWRAMQVPGWRRLFYLGLVLVCVFATIFLLAMGFDRDGPSILQIQHCTGLSQPQILTVALIGVMTPLFALIALGEIVTVVDLKQRFGHTRGHDRRWLYGSIITLAVLCVSGLTLLRLWC